MTRKINSLNIVPLIDILLVLFVVLMVVGRFEDDDSIYKDEAIKELAVTISQQDKEIEELYKRVQLNSEHEKKSKELLSKNKEINKELETLKKDKKPHLEDELVKLKKENKKLKKEQNAISIVCEGVDNYVVNGKRMTLSDVEFLGEIFNGFGLIKYEWYKENPDSVNAKDMFLQRVNLNPIH